MMEKIKMLASDRSVLHVNCWKVDHPKAVVLLAHGMAEHSLRYDRLGNYLNSRQISLYCHDQRGHGETGAKELGHLRKGIDWNLMINDLFTIKKKLIDQENDCPIFLMGHSMGSFLSRRTVQLRPSMFDGLILSGTGDDQGISGKAAVKLAEAGCLLSGQERRAVQLQNIIFGGFNKAIENPRTKFDWLSRDVDEVKKYIEDPLCGFICTNGFYYEMLNGTQLANDMKNIALMRKEMPIYLMSGDQDPVGGLGKGVRHVYEMFKNAGMQDVTLHLYPGGRHEMLNEINREDVMEELADWIDEHITAKEA